jgi:penicillin amidase
LARATFAERDLHAIQLDIRPPLLDRWRGLLQAEAALFGRKDLLASLDDWTGRADPDIVSYRVVKAFRSAVTNRVLRSFTGPIEADLGPDNFPWVHSLSEVSVWTLVSSSTAAPIPPGYSDWEALFRAALDDVERTIAEAGGYGRFQWGRENVTAIHHPLASAVPGLSWLTDPPQVSLPGDRAHLPRINAGDQGASERIVVSPGHEESGIFEMPSGQSGHPLSPYFNSFQEGWVRGDATPFLPGPARWTLRFEKQG